MITYNAASRKSIANAVAKAKTSKPKVTTQADFGKYTVCGSVGDCYTVSFSKVAGEFAADCTCTAGKRGNVCYHVVAASAIYKKAVSDRAAEKAARVVWKTVCKRPEIEAGRSELVCTPEAVAKDRSDLFN